MSDVWLFWDLLLEFTKFSWIGKSMFPVLLASRYHHITSTFFMLSVSPPLLPGRVFWIPRWTWDIVISFPKMGHHLTKILWSYLGFNRLLNVKNDVNTLLCIIYWLNPHSCWLHHSYIPFFRLRSLFYQPLLLVPKSSFFFGADRLKDGFQCIPADEIRGIWSTSWVSVWRWCPGITTSRRRTSTVCSWAMAPGIPPNVPRRWRTSSASGWTKQR